MKLLYGMLLISLLSSLICKITILIEQRKNFGHQLYSEICESYANTPEKPNHLKISHTSDKEDKGFLDSEYKEEPNYIHHAHTVECKGDLKQEWLKIYPVAPCLFNLYENTYLFLFYSEDTKIAFPDSYLRGNVRCSRFFKHLPYLPDKSVFKDHDYELPKRLTELNELTRDQKYDSALALSGELLDDIPSEELEKNDQTLLDYIHENVAFVAIEVYSHYLQKQDIQKEVLDDLKDDVIKVLVKDKLKLNLKSSTFFKRFLLGLFSLYNKDKCEQTIEIFSSAAKLNQGHLEFKQYFVLLGNNDLAIKYLEHAMGIDIPEFKYYKDRIQKYLNPNKKERKFKY
jgi:hypothetical protein